MCKYMIVCFNERNKAFRFLIESADGYPDKISIGKRFSNYKIAQVTRIKIYKIFR